MFTVAAPFRIQAEGSSFSTSSLTLVVMILIPAVPPGVVCYLPVVSVCIKCWDLFPPASQGHVCSNYLNIEIWICDSFLADTKSIIVAYFDLYDFGTNDLPGFQVRKFQRIQLYLTMYTHLAKLFVETLIPFTCLCKEGY